MAVGDVTVTFVKHPTETTLDTAITALGISNLISGSWAMEAYADGIFVVGVEGA